MKIALLAFAALFCAAPLAAAATPPVPAISGPIAGPGPMYPNPAISIVPGAPKVEDFPYVTEEFFVSGTARDASYTTRIIVRRPKDPGAFSGVVIGEALHAGAARWSSNGRGSRY